MNKKMKLIAFAMCIPLSLSLVPTVAFGAVLGSGGFLTAASTALEPCNDNAHQWYLQPAEGEYAEVKCAICGESLTNCVTVSLSGATTTSAVSARVQDGLAKLQSVEALRDYRKRVVLQLTGDATLTIDSDLTADCLVQSADSASAGERFNLVINGDSYHLLNLTDSGIRIRGNLDVTGGVVKASSGNGTALYAAGNMTLSGGKITAAGCDYGIAALGTLLVEGDAVVNAASQAGLAYYAAMRSFQSIQITGGTVFARGGAMGICVSDSVEMTGGRVDTRGDVALFARNEIRVVEPTVVVYPEDAVLVEAEAAAGAGGAVVDGKALGAGPQAVGDVRIATAQAASEDAGSDNNSGGSGGEGDTDGLISNGGYPNSDTDLGGEEGVDTGRVSVVHYKLKIGGTPGVAGDYEAVVGSRQTWSGLKLDAGFPLGEIATRIKYTGFTLSPTALNVSRVIVGEGTEAGIYFDRDMVDVVIPSGLTATYGNGEGVSPATVTIVGNGTAKQIPYGAVLKLEVIDSDGKTGGTVSVDGGAASKTVTVEIGVVAPKIAQPVYASTVAEDKAASQLTAATAESDVIGATLTKLRVQAKASSSKSIKLSWSKVSGATSYAVFGIQCGANNKYVYLDKVSSNTKTYVHSGLKKGKYYRYVVYALQGADKILAKSKTVHAVTSGGKYTNAKKVTLAKKSVTLAVGAKTTMTPSTVKAKASLTIRNHTAKGYNGIRFESTNKKVATVTKAGKIKAKGVGSCYVYAFAQNGVWARTKVTVKR